MSSANAREPRSSVILYACVEKHANVSECRVRNLSATGACLDNGAGLVTGETVTVSMGALAPLSAQVMWANSRLAGLHFDRPIDLAAARQPRARLATSAPAAPAARAAGAVSAGWIQNIQNPYRRG